MTVDAKTLFIHFLLVSAASAVAVQATNADESSAAEVMESGSMRIMRSEREKAQPQAADEPDTKSADEAPSNGKLKIDVYYESRCPDCVEFVNNSIALLWRDSLMSHVELHLNPYGNAMSVEMSQISAGYKFWHPDRQRWEQLEICQHGQEECFANTIHACAIKKLPQDKHMELILCMMAEPNYGIEKSSYECMEKFSIDKDMIKKCTESSEGEHILAEFGKETAKVPNRQGTPWLMINNEHYDATTHNLFKSVCEHSKSSSSTCKPFSDKKKSESSDEDSQGQDSSDYFPVLTKMKSENKDRVILPPPKEV